MIKRKPMKATKPAKRKVTKVASAQRNFKLTTPSRTGKQRIKMTSPGGPHAPTGYRKTRNPKIFTRK